MSAKTFLTNAEWVDALRAGGQAREQALSGLREIIVSGLPYALNRWLSPSDPQFDALVQDVAQETLMRVLDALDSFEGRSQFTTWAHTIAVRVALTELRRRQWKDVSLDSLIADAGDEANMPMLAGDMSETTRPAHQKEMLALIERLMKEELTDKQRTALVAVTFHDMPLEEVARRMGTNRNALYKLLHDARLRLKQRLMREGMTLAEVFALFETG